MQQSSQSSLFQGRSRFSKVLPAPPPSDTSSTSAFPSRDQSLPRPSIRADSDSSKPLNSPLPPLPLQTPARTPKMFIPRKPIGLPTSPLPGHKIVSQQVQEDPQPPLLQNQDSDMKSPGAASISSILSAYTATTTTNSAKRSSDTSSSANSSNPSSSPQWDGTVDATQNQPAPVVFPPRRDSRRQAPALAKMDKSLPVPPPNPVIEVDEQPPSEPRDFSTPAASVQPPKFSDPASSLPRPELWKRRSAIKPDNHLAVPDLKLADSHGSTASPLLRSAPAPAPAAGHSNPPTHLPRSGNSLPGRNIRPVASRPAPAPPQPAIESMGQKDSKLGQRSLSSENGLPPAPSPNKPITPNVAMSARPPTPEYNPTDVHTPIVDTVMSPVSPASSPEPEPRPSKHTIQRRPVDTERSVLPTRTSPTLTSSSPPSVVAKANLDGVSPNVTGLPPQPRYDVETQATTTPGRPSLHRQDPSLPLVEPEHLANPAIKVTDATGVRQAEARSDEAPVQAVKEAQQQDFEMASYSPGIILDAPPLNNAHFACYKHHKFMRQSPNLNYPLGCQACKVKDSEMRWRCDWCCLRICRRCLDGLSETKGRDLAILLAKLGENPGAGSFSG